MKAKPPNPVTTPEIEKAFKVGLMTFLTEFVSSLPADERDGCYSIRADFTLRGKFLEIGSYGLAKGKPTKAHNHTHH